MSRERRSAGAWRRIIREQRRSGLSVADYCRRARVPLSSFYLWRRRLHEAGRFVEVTIAHRGADASADEPAGTERLHSAVERVPSGAIELRLPGARCVVVRPGFDGQTLRALLAVLDDGAAHVAEAEAGA